MFKASLPAHVAQIRCHWPRNGLQSVQEIMRDADIVAHSLLGFRLAYLLSILMKAQPYDS